MAKKGQAASSLSQPVPQDDGYSDSSMASFIDDSEAPPILPQSLTAPRIKRDISTLSIPLTACRNEKKKSKRTLAVEQKSDDYFKALMANFDSDASSSEKEKEIDISAPITPHDPSINDPYMDIDEALLTGELFMDDADLNATTSANPHEPTNQWDITEEDLQACGLFDDLIEQGVDVEQAPQQQSKISLTAEEGSVTMWWLDAHERYDGLIILFGKTWDESSSSYVSCAVQVHNSLRNVFILPREFIQDTDEEGVTFEAVRKELAELAGRYGVPRFGCRMVSRKYAFEVPDIPVEADYLKMVYEFTYPALPADLQGKTFSNVFGAKSSALELFLLKRRIMGPCWIKLVPSPKKHPRVTHCRVNWAVDDPKSIHVITDETLPAPPISILSLSLRTTYTRNSISDATGQHEVLLASCLYYPSVNIEKMEGNVKCGGVFNVIKPVSANGFNNKFAEQICRLQKGKLNVCRTEKALLQAINEVIVKCDPDVLLGHDIAGFTLPVLAQRMKSQRVEGVQLGRLAFKQWPKGTGTGPNATGGTYADRQLVSGRLLLDTYLSAKEFVRAKNYSLAQLAETVLGVKRESLDLDTLTNHFSDPSSLSWLITHCEGDTQLCMQLSCKLQVLPLTRQLTSLAGNLWSRTLTAGRAERNEYLLLHEFHDAKYIVPDKHMAVNQSKIQEEEEASSEEEAHKPSNSKKQTAGSGRRKPAYAGGLVLEPKKGFYDKLVLLLDFNSLYPSIIQEYNICFTTVERHAGEEDKLPNVPRQEIPTGVLPRILANIVARRKAIKGLMKDPSTPPSQLAQYQIRQQALKLTANSMYGCLGFTHSRFFARPLAMLITAKGRETLSATVELACNACSLDVIYGDTDSIMINTGTDDLAKALQLAQQVKRIVNEKYRLLEIDVDGVFAKLLLLKKKKYAALVIDDLKSTGKPLEQLPCHIESKGLDLVRRDWCPLAVEVSTFVLDRMMSMTRSQEGSLAQLIHQQLSTLASQLHQLPVSKFVISKNLTKEPGAYADARSQPHVSVALRMRAKGLTVSVGNTIPYVICRATKPSDSLAERSHHPDDIIRDPSIVIDFDWYLGQQLHPVITRLCEFIEDTDASRIAAALGLDTRKYQRASSVEKANVRPLYTRMNPSERFKECEQFKLRCSNCEHVFAVTTLAKFNGTELTNCLQCMNCSQVVSPHELLSQMHSILSHQHRLHASTQFQCDDKTCSLITSRPSADANGKCTRPKCTGRLNPIITPESFYHLLLYHLHILDVDSTRLGIVKASGSNPDSLLSSLKSVSAMADPTRAMLHSLIAQNAYGTINLGGESLWNDEVVREYRAVIGERFERRMGLLQMWHMAA